MSLLRDQKKRGNPAVVQQIKDLARAGKWQEAKNLVDTLPSTPDNIKLKERVEKQLYIATGEVPSVMEGSPVLADEAVDAEMDAALLTAIVKRKSRQTEDEIPAYMPIRIVGNLVYGIGVFAIVVGVASLAAAPVLGDGSLAGTGFTAIISGLFSMASGSMMKLFVDMAQNTFRTNRLLVQLLYKDSSIGGKQDVAQ